MGPDSGQLVARILNSAYMVRHYSRGGRMSPSSPVHRKRAEAIHDLGMVVRAAFNASEDFEALLTAVYHGLAPNADPPF